MSYPVAPRDDFELIDLDRMRRQRQRRRTRGTLSTLIVIGLVLAGLVAALVFQKQIAYGIAMIQYPPSGSVVALADRAGLTDEGERVLYTSRPTLETSEVFNDSCPSDDDWHVLGCYDGGRIHVFKVMDPRLDGTNVVTLAHEMLHAAYDELDDEERSRVDALIEAQVALLSADHELFEIMAGYEAEQRLTELHSRFGTELAELSPELEAYYSRYFTGRPELVALEEKSGAALDQVQAEMDAASAEATALFGSTSADLTAHAAAVEALNAEYRALSNMSYTDIEQFNSALAALDSRANELNLWGADIDARITRYNELVATLDQLGADAEELWGSLDSTAPAAG